MKIWTIINGVMTVFAGRAAAREVVKIVPALRAALIALAVFMGLLAVGVGVTTFFVILKIIEWFLG